MDFLLGILGVLVGGLVSWVGICIKHKLDNQAGEKLDNLRKKDLRTMLENPPNGVEWRKLETLSRVIGADYETTTRLLVEIGARGSETENQVWALKTKKPLR